VSKNNRWLTHGGKKQVFYSRQCTCKVSAENSVDNVDRYIMKVAPDLPR